MFKNLGTDASFATHSVWERIGSTKGKKDEEARRREEEKLTNIMKMVKKSKGKDNSDAGKCPKCGQRNPILYHLLTLSTAGHFAYQCMNFLIGKEV